MENQLTISLGRNKLLKNVDIMKMDLRNIKGRLITIGEGEILYREGDFADTIFLVVSGEVNVLKKRLLGKTKSFIFSENDFFGQEEFFEETNRTSTAVALRDSYLISLSKEEIDQLLRQDGQILLNLREPIAEFNDETGSLKSIISQTKDEFIQKPINQESVIQEETKKVEEPQHQDFFQSISDSSRAKEENLVQPLEELRHTFVEEPAVFTSPTQETKEEFPFEQNLFNEDGIIKAEFEIPEDADVNFHPLEVTSPGEVRESFKATHEEDLNDALFNMLSGSIPPAKAPEPSSLSSSSKPANNEDDNFFATMGIKEPLVEEKNIPEKPVYDEKPKYDFTSAAPVNVPREEKKKTPLPKITKDYDSEEAFAEADAKINSLVNKPKIESKEPEVPFTDLRKTIFSTKDHSAKMTHDELEMILQAAELVNSTIKVDEVLRNIVTVAIELTSADRGTLYLVDHEKKELWSLVLLANEIREIRLNIGEGLAGYVAKTGETINIKDVQNDPRFNKDFDRASGYITKSMLCFPIKNNVGKTIGVLQLLNSKSGHFSDRDETFLAALSIHAAMSLQNAELVEKLLQTERVHSLGKMANFLIQDIKKPILVSKRYAEHLLNKQLPTETTQIIEMLLEQLVHVVDIVQTTSSYSEGKTVLRTINTSLNNTLADYASRVDNFVVSKSCQIFNEFEKDVTVRIDIKEFFQCYMHIIKNACDAMPEGGSIHISTKKEDKKVKIFIKDSGLGIPEGFKDKIFEPFMSYGKKEGTGLGLAITKKIVEAHNGSIDVESITGSGATFIISLPVAALY